MHRKYKLVLLLLTITSLLGGCFGGNSEMEPMKDGKGKLKIVYKDEESFNRDYGNLFLMKYPDIEVEVIAQDDLFDQSAEQNAPFDLNEEKKKVIEKFKPDVLLLNESMFETFAQDGRLYDLDMVINQDKYDINGFMPGLIDRLKEKGNGKLFGLAPYFETPVLYYNRGLFKQYNIEPPRDQMSWKELLDLASRFAKEGAYGLYQTEKPEKLVYDIAAGSGLRLVDAKGEKLLIQSEGWKEAITMTTEAIRNKSVYIPEQDANNERMDRYYEPFHQEKAAMTFQESWFSVRLKEVPMYEKTPKIDWGIVTTPVDPASPNESAYVHLSEIYSISANSENKRAAWEFIQFVNGTDMAQVATLGNNGKLPTRTGYFKDLEGRSTEPFYLLKPKQGKGLLDDKNIPHGFYDLFDPLLAEALQAIIDKQKTIDEALAELEMKGQQALIKARETAAKKS